MATPPIQSTAPAAMKAAAHALKTSANNVANVNTPGHEAEKSVQSAGEGGPTTTTHPTGNPAPIVSGAEGLIALSNTDLVEETLVQAQALTQFKAAVAALETANELHDDTLDITA